MPPVRATKESLPTGLLQTSVCLRFAEGAAGIQVPFESNDLQLNLADLRIKFQVSAVPADLVRVSCREPILNASV
jgi:hypothetical protein